MPFWALTFIVIDILVIYNLAVYGRDFQQSQVSPGRTLRPPPA